MRGGRQRRAGERLSVPEPLLASPPMARALATILLLTGLFTALAGPVAHADYRDLILDGCGRDERVNGTYSQKDYREALSNLSDDQLQYTDCEAILRAAQRA